MKTNSRIIGAQFVGSGTNEDGAHLLVPKPALCLDLYF